MDKHVEKMQLRQNNPNVWHTDLMGTMVADTPCKREQGFMFCLQQLACIFSILACLTGNEELQEASQCLNCLSDLTYCTVCACMQTQHKLEMDKRDGKFGPQPMMGVPPVQNMSRIDQAVPPSVGYPPPPAYGQPYGYPPQPQAQGYPPAGYPPSNYPRFVQNITLYMPIWASLNFIVSFWICSFGFINGLDLNNRRPLLVKKLG
ncbi:hypothetical protein CJ030_MR3G012268 [Morella rubra]|uniref:PLAC8 family protein n=1 Tax=Morella rubra TaxID=262757 RepID=A0A6A1W2L8_9ROSI|nr:hypothetical protein CJ030_MR3G012268 [Morella rubra]